MNKIRRENQTIVDRKTWLRNDAVSVLQDAAGRKCCLGFEIIQHHPSVVLTGRFATPQACSTDLPKDSWLLSEGIRDSILARTCMVVNDSLLGQQQMGSYTSEVSDLLEQVLPGMILRSEADREVTLIKLFAMGGRELSFIN